MKVLGIVSSPRKGGNSELAVKEMMMNLPSDWEKEMIRLNELELKNCTACYKCLPEDARCPLDDDLNFYIDKVRSADKVIMAGPAYCYGGHTSFKVSVDRMLAVSANYEEFCDKECVLAGFYGDEGCDGFLKEDMLIAAKQFNMKVVDSAVMLATLPGDSVKGDNLETVRKLAKALVEGQPMVEVPEQEILCPACSARTLQITTGSTWRCVLCGAEGTVKTDGERLSLLVGMAPSHFTKSERAAQNDYRDEKKKLFIETRKEVKALQAKYAEMDIWVKPE